MIRFASFGTTMAAQFPAILLPHSCVDRPRRVTYNHFCTGHQSFGTGICLIIGWVDRPTEPQGLKPLNFWCFSAQLKPCPDGNRL